MGEKMLHIDEDDYFVGSPQSKFFDILFNANKNLVKDTLEKHVERHAAMEILLEKLCAQTEIDIEDELMHIKVEQLDKVHHYKTDFFISTVGDILTQNE